MSSLHVTSESMTARGRASQKAKSQITTEDVDTKPFAAGFNGRPTTPTTATGEVVLEISESNLIPDTDPKMGQFGCIILC